MSDERRTCFVVVGWNGGSYSDSREWVAAAAIDRATAEAHVAKLEAWLAEAQRTMLESDGNEIDHERFGYDPSQYPAPPGDAGWDWDAGGLEYNSSRVKWSVREVPFLEGR